MAYIPFTKRKKEEEGVGYTPFSQSKDQVNKDSQVPAKKVVTGMPSYSLPALDAVRSSIPKKQEKPGVQFGIPEINNAPTMADGFQFKTKTSTPQMTDYGTIDAIQDAFYRKQVAVRPLFGAQGDEVEVGGVIPAGILGLGSRIIEATPRIALATVANYNLVRTKGKDTDVNAGFDVTRLGFEIPEGERRDLVQDTGTRMINDFNRRMEENPDKAKTNIALSVLNTTIVDLLDAVGVGGITEVAARQVLKSTQYNPALRGSLQQLGLDGKEVTYDTVKSEFTRRAENIIEAGGDVNELNELGRATNEIMTALNGSGVPQLNKMGQVLEDSSVFVTQDISKGIQYGQPRLRPLGETPKPQAETTLPGYRPFGGGRPQPAVGLSVQPVEPVGFGDDVKNAGGFTEDKTLVGVHNLSEENLKAASDIGGLARPSMAIIDAKKSEFGNFGEVTLIAPSEVIDPKNGYGATFASDAYSPRFPDTAYSFPDRSTRDDFFDANNAIVKKYLGEDFDYSAENKYQAPSSYARDVDIDDPSHISKSDLGLQLRFMEENNLTPVFTEDGKYTGRFAASEISDQIKDAGKWDEFKKFADDTIENLKLERRHYSGRDYYGRPKYKPYTLENAVKIMGKKIRDGEGFNYGLGSIRSSITPQFRSIGSIKKNKDRIVSTRDFTVAKEEMERQFSDLSERLARASIEPRDGWGTSEVLGQFIASKSDRRWFYEMFDPDEQLLADIAQFADNLKKMPTEYFETKIKGAMELNAFSRAVVPDNATGKTLEILKENNIEPVFYKAGDEADRAEKIREIARGNTGEAFSAGGISGIEEDENGEIKIDPIKFAMGAFFGTLARGGGKQIKRYITESDIVPKTGFHGTNKKAAAAIILNGFKANDGVWGEGIYLGKDEDVVQKFYADKIPDKDGVVFEVETNVENPLVLDKKYTGLFDTAKADPELQRLIGESVPGKEQINLVKYAKKKGYDGIFAKDVNEMVVFDDSQITKITIDGKVIRDVQPENAIDDAYVDDWGQPGVVSEYEEMIDMLPGETEEIARLRADIEEKTAEVEIFRESLESMPAAGLAPYVARRGEFKGELPEALGGNSRYTGKFSNNGDDIVTELGFDDSESARAAWLDFVAQKEQYKEMLDGFKDLKKNMQALRFQEKENDAFIKAISKEIQQKLNKKIYSKWQMQDRVAKAKVVGQKKGEAAGRRVGYAEAKKQITNRLRNSFGIQLRNMKRGAELDKLKMRIIERNRDIVRAQLTDYVSANLPVSERGKFISMLKNADTQRKLVKAYARVDDAVQDIRRKDIVTDLQKKVKKLSQSPSIAVEYRSKIASIVSDLAFKKPSAATIKRLREVREVIERQKAAGENVTIPERLIKQMEILSKKNVGNQRTADLINLSETVDLLAQLGKAKQATRERLYEMEKKRRLDQLVAEISPMDKSPLMEAKPGEKLSIKDKFRNVFPSLLNAAQHVDLSLAPMDVFFDFLGGAKGTYESAPSRIFKATTDSNYSGYLEKKDPIVASIWNKADELGLDKRNFERIGIHAARVQKDGIEKLLNTGIDEGDINSLVLSDAEMELYNIMRSQMEALKPEIDDVMRTVYNQEVGKVENYFSFMTDFDAMSETEVFQRLGGNELQEFGYATKNVEQGFTKSRTGAGKQKIKIDAMEIFTKHIDNAAYLINMARDNKMLYEIANSPEFGAAAGDLGQRYTLEWLDTVSRKGGKSGDERIAFLDAMRRNVGAAYLGFKLSTVLIQPTALFDGASEIGSWAFSGAAGLTKSRAVRGFVLKQFPEIRARVGDDQAFMDMGSNETLNRIRDAGYYGIKKVDTFAAGGVAWGAYTQKLSKAGFSVRLTDDGADKFTPIYTDKKTGKVATIEQSDKLHKDALEYAERVVRNTQASSLFKDSPRAITRGGFSGNRSVDRALFQFQTFVIRRWYRVRHDFWNAGIREKDPLKAFNIIMYLSLAFLAEEGLRRAGKELIDTVTGKESEEEFTDGYTEAVAQSVLSTVPFMSQSMSMAVYKSDPVPALGAVRSITGGTYQFLDSTKPETKLKGLIELSEGVGAAWGVPGTAQTSQLLKGAIDSNTQASEDDELDLDLDMGDDLDLDLDLDLDI